MGDHTFGEGCPITRRATVPAGSGFPSRGANCSWDDFPVGAGVQGAERANGAGLPGAGSGQACFPIGGTSPAAYEKNTISMGKTANFSCGGRVEHPC